MNFRELANVQVRNAIPVTANPARSAIILPWSKPRHFPSLLLSDIVARCCKTLTRKNQPMRNAFSTGRRLIQIVVVLLGAYVLPMLRPGEIKQPPEERLRRAV